MQGKIYSQLILCLLVVGCDTSEVSSIKSDSALSSGKTITRTEYGSSWPFTVESGAIDCVDRFAAIFISNNVRYQLTGFASTMGYKPIDSIWRDNPEIPGSKVSLGPITQLALERCEKSEEIPNQ